MISKVRIGLAVVVVISSILGVMDIVDIHIINPILFIALAFILIINARENYKASKKLGAGILIFIAIAMIIFALIELYIGLMM